MCDALATTLCQMLGSDDMAPCRTCDVLAVDHFWGHVNRRPVDYTANCY